MRIRRRTNNEYHPTQAGIWLRDPGGSGPVCEVDPLHQPDEYRLLMANETANRTVASRQLDPKRLGWTKVAIVSDGIGWQEAARAAAAVRGVTIVTTHRAAVAWPAELRKPDYYVVSDPSVDALGYLPPAKQRPTCIASVRVWPEFLTRYGGTVLFYRPAPDGNFNPSHANVQIRLSDYRNPICAALHACHLADAEAVLLCGHGVGLPERREGAVEFKPGRWAYQAQVDAQSVVLGFAALIGKYRRVAACGDAIDSPVPVVDPAGVASFFDGGDRN